MAFHCADCTQTFETKSRMNTHRMKEHQRKAQLKFNYGTFLIYKDNSTEQVEFPEGSQIKCPRCDAQFLTIKYLQVHCRKVCKGPAASVSVEPLSNIFEPLDICWTAIEGTNSLLYLHQELGVVLCRVHNHCIPKEFMSSHLQKQHKVNATIPAEILARINDSTSETLETFFNRPNNAVVPNIQVHQGHFKCSSCPKIYSKKRNAATHFKYLHSGLTAGNFSRVDCQTLFQHPLHLRYFVVAENSIENAALYYVEAIPNFEEDVSVDESGMVPLIEHPKSV